MNKSEKVSSEKDLQAIRLSGIDWIRLIAIISGSCVAMVIYGNNQAASNTALIQKVDTSNREMIRQLDEKWQGRILDVTHEIKTEIKDLETNIPPQWLKDLVADLRSQVKENRELIQELRLKVRRDE